MTDAAHAVAIAWAARRAELLDVVSPDLRRALDRLCHVGCIVAPDPPALTDEQIRWRIERVGVRGVHDHRRRNFVERIVCRGSEWGEGAADVPEADFNRVLESMTAIRFVDTK